MVESGILKILLVWVQMSNQIHHVLKIAKEVIRNNIECSQDRELKRLLILELYLNGTKRLSQLKTICTGNRMRCQHFFQFRVLV